MSSEYHSWNQDAYGNWTCPECKQEAAHCTGAQTPPAPRNATTVTLTINDLVDIWSALEAQLDTAEGTSLMGTIDEAMQHVPEWSAS